MILIRVCAYCRCQIQGQGSQTKAFGPTLERRENETSGICYSCFAVRFGTLDEKPKERARA